MKRFISFLPLLVLASSAQADSLACRPTGETLVEVESARTKALNACKLIGATRSEIKQILLKTIKPNIHILKRKVYLYHYGQNPTGSNDPVRHDDRRLAEKYFYDPASERDFFKPNQGYSLYMASNPLVSVDYSRDPGLLLRLGVPPGVKFLDEKLKLSNEDANRLWCYLNTLPSAVPEHEIECSNSLSLSRLIDASPEAAALLRETMKPLGIQMLWSGFRRSIFKDCAGENPQLKMIDPRLAPKLEMTLYSAHLEKNPSPEKRAAYEEVFQYFSAITAEEVTAIRSSVEPKFWSYYKSWAPILRDLPLGADLRAYQKRQSDAFKSQRAELLKKDFGCGVGSANQDELLRD